MGFKKCILAIILVSVLCVSCKKNGTKVEPQNVFSFTYKGQTYRSSRTGDVVNAGVGRNQDGSPTVRIGMYDVFGGQIYFESQNCAYLEPQFKSIRANRGCILLEVNTVGQLVPIDSVKVFIYQSGSKNISFSNYVSRTETDLFTGASRTYTLCSAAGTFDLTLVNKNKETIKITDGVIRIDNIRFD